MKKLLLENQDTLCEIIVKSLLVMFGMSSLVYFALYEYYCRDLSTKKAVVYLIIWAVLGIWLIISCLDSIKFYKNLNEEIQEYEENRKKVISKFGLSDQEVEIICVNPSMYSKFQRRRMKLMNVTFWAKLTSKGNIKIRVKSGSIEVEKPQKVDFRCLDANFELKK